MIHRRSVVVAALALVAVSLAAEAPTVGPVRTIGIIGHAPTALSDLPIDRAAKFELAINLKTAGALNLTIPPPVLLRADHVVQ